MAVSGGLILDGGIFGWNANLHPVVAAGDGPLTYGMFALPLAA